jgi:hypothetical protein
VRINLDAVELNADSGIVRLSVKSGLLDNQLETADERRKLATPAGISALPWSIGWSG